MGLAPPNSLVWEILDPPLLLKNLPVFWNCSLEVTYQILCDNTKSRNVSLQSEHSCSNNSKTSNLSIFYPKPVSVKSIGFF